MHAQHGSPAGQTDAVEALIRAHYDDFNSRQLERAAGRFHPDARIEHITGQVEFGPRGFGVLALQWLSAFPDGQLTVQHIRSHGGNMYDVDLVATGTHTGPLAFGSWSFGPSEVVVRLPARELFEIAEGQFRSASLTFDLQGLVRQLATIDVARLQEHIARIGQLGDALAAETDPLRQRELIDRLGGQLDAARRVVRPYFRAR